MAETQLPTQPKRPAQSERLIALANYFLVRRPLAGAVAAILVLALAAAAIYATTHHALPGALNNKQQAQALVAAGLKYQANGQTSQALADYNAAISLDPTNKYAYYDRGVIEQNQNQSAKAEADYRKAISLDSKFEDALYNLAVLLQAASPTSAEAESLYRRVIAIDSHNARAHLNLGFILLAQGNKAGARAEFNVAVALDPSLKSRIPADV